MVPIGIGHAFGQGLDQGVGHLGLELRVNLDEETPTFLDVRPVDGIPVDEQAVDLLGLAGDELLP